MIGYIAAGLLLLMIASLLTRLVIEIIHGVGRLVHD